MLWTFKLIHLWIDPSGVVFWDLRYLEKGLSLNWEGAWYFDWAFLAGTCSYFSFTFLDEGTDSLDFMPDTNSWQRWIFMDFTQNFYILFFKKQFETVDVNSNGKRTYRNQSKYFRKIHNGTVLMNAFCYGITFWQSVLIWPKLKRAE